jgi:hypothetical protein
VRASAAAARFSEDIKASLSISRRVKETPTLSRDCLPLEILTSAASTVRGSSSGRPESSATIAVMSFVMEAMDLTAPGFFE